VTIFNIGCEFSQENQRLLIYVEII